MPKPETKFVKAHCVKHDRYFGLEVRKVGREWKVVNMVDLPDEDARLLSSEVKQDRFVSNENLLPCSRCGSRVVGGCACGKKTRNCGKHADYQLDCLYCNECKIDYSLPTRSAGGVGEGEVVRLSQGQEVKIRYADDSPLTGLWVGVGWDPAVGGGENIDVDSSVIVSSSNNGSFDLVYFGNKTHSSGCVVHHGDNLTGRGDGQGDDENITVNLQSVPANRDRLYFVLNIYNCVSRKQTFGSIRNLYIRLSSLTDRKPLIEYPVEGNFSRYTSLIIGCAIRTRDGWSFKALGVGENATDVHKLATHCASRHD